MIKPEKSYNQKTITKRNCCLFKTTQYFSKKKALSDEKLSTQTLYPQTEKNETSEEIYRDGLRWDLTLKHAN